MEFIVRALRGWAVPLVIPIPQAWRVFQQGQLLNDGIASLLEHWAARSREPPNILRPAALRHSTLVVRRRRYNQ
jgi:hypothetical protein